MQRQRVPTRYLQTELTISLNALAAGGDASDRIFDNSGDFGGEVVRINKLTMQTWMEGMDDVRPLLVAVVRDTEDVANPSLDVEGTVRDLRNENKLLRGPWHRSTALEASATSNNDLIFTKTIVMKNIVLDQNDDLKLCVTNIGSVFGATPQNIHGLVKAYWRTVS